ncbi:MAG TPA: hypothetical protein VNK82_02795 [Terriglobales bacterium]|nr:hypothetical protein [Terriglobales bacterium]
MTLLRAQLLVLAALLSAFGQGRPKAEGPDPLCGYFQAVLREAPTNFVGLRGKPMEGYSIPLWQGKLKAPGSTSCQVTEKSYVCSLGFRPDQAKGKREFEALAQRVLACFPGWRIQSARGNDSWTFALLREEMLMAVDFECLQDCSFKKDPRPELFLRVQYRRSVVP